MTDSEKEKLDFIEEHSELTDKKLLSIIAFNTKKTKEESERIRQNVVFFFWIVIIQIVAVIWVAVGSGILL